MIPIVNDLTVGMAMEQYHHECRRPRGVYLSIDHAEAIEEAFANLGAGPGDIDLILATDAEQVLGIGDWGVGGIEVSIGKLAIYTAAGGIDPTRVIPVMLDVGTNRESLLSDPMYIGNRHARIRGERYDAFIDAYVKVVDKAVSQRVVAVGGLCAGQWTADPREVPRPDLHFQRRYAGHRRDHAGGGHLRRARLRDAAAQPARGHLRSRHGGHWSRRPAPRRHGARGALQRGCSQALLVRGPAGIAHHRHGRPTARLSGGVRPPGRRKPAPGSTTANGNGVGLAEVVRRVKPTMLIGASTVGGSFTEAIVRDMAAHTERPIIFALCHPAARAAANPADLLAWTDGRALIATGSSFAPVTHKGVTYVIGQVNNAMLYPGLALGTIVSRASRISEGMFAAAASAVSSLVTVRQPGASLLPHIDDLRSVSATVAVAVAEAADGGRLGPSQIRRYRATGPRRDVAAGIPPGAGNLKEVRCIDSMR